MDQFLQVALNGLTLAAVYFLVASGLSLIFGLMRVITMAHGTSYLLGGYIGYVVVRETGNWLLGAIVAAARSGWWACSSTRCSSSGSRTTTCGWP